MIFNQEVVH